jgi:hypothetical protein
MDHGNYSSPLFLSLHRVSIYFLVLLVTRHEAFLPGVIYDNDY